MKIELQLVLQWFFYLLNFGLFLSGLFTLRLKNANQVFSLTLLRTIILLPILSVEYIYFIIYFQSESFPLIFFSENLFALIWLSLSYQFYIVRAKATYKPIRFVFPELVVGIILVLITVYYQFYSSTDLLIKTNIDLTFLFISPISFFSVIQIAIMLVMIFHIEQFWKPLPLTIRWSYKYFAVGCVLVSLAFCLSFSQRFLYLRIVPDYLFLLSIVLLLAFICISFSVVRHRLLSRKIYIISESISPAMMPSISFAYLAAIGIAYIGIHHFNRSLPSIIGFILILAIITLAFCVTFSQSANRRVKDYINTHFSIKKYEYREAWLTFCNYLQESFSDAGVARALATVIVETMYSENVIIWTGNEERGFHATFPGTIAPDKIKRFSSNETIITYLKNHQYFYSRYKEDNPDWQTFADQYRDFLTDHELVLLFPLLINDVCVGLIGVGSEFNHGIYGRDDFDLLTALGTQAASALLTIEMAEKLASIREKEAWDKFSTFVLHDIKNVANMLSIVLENAKDHMHNSEFQQDMLECVNSALQRMNKVKDRLDFFKGEASPHRQEIDLGSFVAKACQRFDKTLVGMKIEYTLPESPLKVWTDPEKLFPALENIIHNAFEAAGGDVVISVEIFSINAWAHIMIKDNGPGIAEDLLPDKLFYPFKTSKEKGSGIGLWQAKQMITFLEGTIIAKNIDDNGACFEIRLPLGG